MNEPRSTALAKVTILDAVSKTGAIAEVLARDEELNECTSRGDEAGVEDFYSENFLLNGPNNRIQDRAATVAAIGRSKSAPGKFRYVSYERTVEAARCAGDIVVLMGSETTVAEGVLAGMDGRPVTRRFTDLWHRENGNWKKLARQSTVVLAG